MAVSEARKRATAKYNKKTYDRIEMKVPKGEKDIIQAHAEKFDGSLNKFLNRAVSTTIQSDNKQNTPAQNGTGSNESDPR